MRELQSAARSPSAAKQKYYRAAPPPLPNRTTLCEFGQKNNGESELLLCHAARVALSRAFFEEQGACSALRFVQVLVLSRDTKFCP